MGSSRFVIRERGHTEPKGPCGNGGFPMPRTVQSRDIWPTSLGVALASMLFCSTAAQCSRRSCAKDFASRSQCGRTASRRSLWRTTSRPWLWPAEPRNSGPCSTTEGGTSQRGLPTRYFWKCRPRRRMLGRRRSHSCVSFPGARVRTNCSRSEVFRLKCAPISRCASGSIPRAVTTRVGPETSLRGAKAISMRCRRFKQSSGPQSHPSAEQTRPFLSVWSRG